LTQVKAGSDEALGQSGDLLAGGGYVRGEWGRCSRDADDPRHAHRGARLAHQIGPDDRLIIKLYQSTDGIETDATYQVVPRFELPLEFVAAPSIDMSGRTKFDAYLLELFTDKDGDVLSIAPGELIAHTPEPVPLGTTDLRLELNATRE
jgi:hypothetical protein